MGIDIYVHNYADRMELRFVHLNSIGISEDRWVFMLDIPVSSTRNTLHPRELG